MGGGTDQINNNQSLISDTSNDFTSQLATLQTELQSLENKFNKISLADKLNLSGGEIAGDLEIQDNLILNSTAKTEDIIPKSDDNYDLGSEDKGWDNAYIHSLHGSSILTIGDGDTSHDLNNTDDLLVSGDLEVNGTAYFDGNINLNSNLISNLINPVSNQDAATKYYVDTQMAGAGYQSGSGVALDMSDGDSTFGLITNIGATGTDFTTGGGLTLAGVISAGSASAHTLGSLGITAGAITGITGLNSITSTELGYLDGVTDEIQTQFSNLGTAKENSIASGDSGYFYRGDKSWAAITQANVSGLTTASSPTFAGLTLSGILNMGNSAIQNIGSVGTDFTGTGGLTLSDILTVSSGGMSIYGNSDFLGNLAITGDTTTTGGVDIGGDATVRGDLKALFRKPVLRDLIGGFEDAAEWVEDGDADCVSPAWETNETTIPAVLYGAKSLSMTFDDGVCNIYKTGAWDFTNKDFSIAVNFYNNSDDVTQFQIKFTDGSGAYASIDNLEDYYALPYGSQTTSTVGAGQWQHLEFSRANVTGTACYDNTANTRTCSQSGTLDWTNITRIDFNFTGTAASNSKVYLDNFEYFNSPPFGFAITRIDHANIGIYTDARQILQTNDISPVIAMSIPEDETDSSILNFAQIKATKSYGWEVVNHTISHPEMSDLTYNQQKSELLAAKKNLDDNGFSTGNRFFAIPFGGNLNIDYNTKDLIKTYFSRGFGATNDSVGVWNQKDPWYTNGVCQWSVGGAPVTAEEINAEIALMQKCIDDASIYHGVTSLLFHDIENDINNDISAASFTTIMEYLRSKINSTAGTANMIVPATYSEIEDLWKPDPAQVPKTAESVSRNALLSLSYDAHISAIKRILSSDTGYTAGDIKLLINPIAGSGTEIDYSADGNPNPLTYSGALPVTYRYRIDPQDNSISPPSMFNPMINDFNYPSKYLYRADDTDFSFGDGTNDTDFGICMWADVKDVVGTGQTLAFKEEASAGKRGWEFFLVSDERVTFKTYDGNTNNFLTKLGNTAMSAGIHHICATYQASGGARRILIYIDGVLDTTTDDSTGGTYLAQDDDNSILTIGTDLVNPWDWESAIGATVITKGLAPASATIQRLYDAGKYYYMPY